MSENNTGPWEPGADRPGAVPLPTGRPPTRHGIKVQNAICGGLLTGLGLAVALLGVAHVVIEAIQQQYDGMGGTIFLVAVIAGPMFGLGLGMMTTALIPDEPAITARAATAAAGPAVVAPPGS
jgi:hypothetical protein